MNFAKFSGTPILQNPSGWLLLQDTCTLNYCLASRGSVVRDDDTYVKFNSYKSNPLRAGFSREWFWHAALLLLWVKHCFLLNWSANILREFTFNNNLISFSPAKTDRISENSDLSVVAVSTRRWTVKKGVLENFAKFTGKHLYQSLFLIKLKVWGLELY